MPFDLKTLFDAKYKAEILSGGLNGIAEGLDRLKPSGVKLIVCP